MRIVYRTHTLCFLILLFAGLTLPSRAQNTYHAVVKDKHHDEPIAGVNVVLEGSTLGAASDVEGLVFLTGIPAGRHTIIFSFIGFEPQGHVYTFPLANPDELHVVYLEEAHEEMEVVSVTATRTSRTIADMPTRVETIAGEEIDEKISMEPANISMLLNESPGITVQQTSATSGNASIRIQGLDGRYTQILMDGFPLYGGFSGGLSILQVPPLDLAQVEVIKGPSSTLYGGDAIAGLINLVSKQPTGEPELSLLVNGTTAGGLDGGGFYTARGNRFGTTFLVTGNLQRAYDPDADDFSNMPETRRLTVSPKFFFYPSVQTTLSVGVSGMFEDREGGDLHVLQHGPDAERTFFERNLSNRFTSRIRIDHAVGNRVFVTVKNSMSLFGREIEVPGYSFDGQQVSSYTEASVLVSRQMHDLVLGLDLRTDAFREAAEVNLARDYTYTSLGSFVQDTWDVTGLLAVEAGLRADYHNVYGLFVLPKASLLYRLTENLSARIGGGLGYKAPTVFLESSEERAFRGVVPLSKEVEAESSQGGSVDVNYRTLLFDRVAVAINQAFYFTNLQHPLVADEAALAEGLLRYRSADGGIRTRATETNAKFSMGAFKLFLGYVYLYAQADYDHTKTPLPLTPRHKTYTVLVYERHGRIRIGLEAYYTGPQRLTDGTTSEGYWVTGIMAERRIGPARFFLNFENFLDTKQSNYAPVVLGTRSNPRFVEIWAPMDGFVINGGVKYTL